MSLEFFELVAAGYFMGRDHARPEADSEFDSWRAGLRRKVNPSLGGNVIDLAAHEWRRG